MKQGLGKARKEGTVPKQMKAYRQRDKVIKRLGFSSYRQYLASSLWAEIRRRVLDKNPNCVRCQGPADQVHHGRYIPENLTGKTLKHLYSVCRHCHHQAEFVLSPFGRGKLTPKHATERLLL